MSISSFRVIVTLVWFLLLHAPPAVPAAGTGCKTPERGIEIIYEPIFAKDKARALFQEQNGSDKSKITIQVQDKTIDLIQDDQNRCEYEFSHLPREGEGLGPSAEKSVLKLFRHFLTPKSNPNMEGLAEDPDLAGDQQSLETTEAHPGRVTYPVYPIRPSWRKAVTIDLVVDVSESSPFFFMESRNGTQIVNKLLEIRDLVNKHLSDKDTSRLYLLAERLEHVKPTELEGPIDVIAKHIHNKIHEAGPTWTSYYELIHALPTVRSDRHHVILFFTDGLPDEKPAGGEPPNQAGHSPSGTFTAGGKAAVPPRTDNERIDRLTSKPACLPLERNHRGVQRGISTPDNKQYEDWAYCLVKWLEDRRRRPLSSYHFFMIIMPARDGASLSPSDHARSWRNALFQGEPYPLELLPVSTTQPVETRLFGEDAKALEEVTRYVLDRIGFGKRIVIGKRWAQNDLDLFVEVESTQDDVSELQGMQLSFNAVDQAGDSKQHPIELDPVFVSHTRGEPRKQQVDSVSETTLPTSQGIYAITVRGGEGVKFAGQRHMIHPYTQRGCVKVESSPALSRCIPIYDIPQLYAKQSVNVSVERDPGPGWFPVHWFRRDISSLVPLLPVLGEDKLAVEIRHRGFPWYSVDLGPLKVSTGTLKSGPLEVVKPRSRGDASLRPSQCLALHTGLDQQCWKLTIDPPFPGEVNAVLEAPLAVAFEDGRQPPRRDLLDIEPKDDHYSIDGNLLKFTVDRKYYNNDYANATLYILFILCFLLLLCAFLGRGLVRCFPLARSLRNLKGNVEGPSVVCGCPPAHPLLSIKDDDPHRYRLCSEPDDYIMVYDKPSRKTVYVFDKDPSWHNLERRDLEYLIKHQTDLELLVRGADGTLTPHTITWTQNGSASVLPFSTDGELTFWEIFDPSEYRNNYAPWWRIVDPLYATANVCRVILMFVRALVRIFNGVIGCIIRPPTHFHSRFEEAERHTLRDKVAPYLLPALLFAYPLWYLWWYNGKDIGILGLVIVTAVGTVYFVLMSRHRYARVLGKVNLIVLFTFVAWVLAAFGRDSVIDVVGLALARIIR